MHGNVRGRGRPILKYLGMSELASKRGDFTTSRLKTQSGYSLGFRTVPGADSADSVPLLNS